MRSDTNYTKSQQQYIDAVGGGAHSRAIEIIGQLERSNVTLIHDNRILVEERDALRNQVLELLSINGTTPRTAPCEPLPEKNETLLPCAQK